MEDNSDSFVAVVHAIVMAVETSGESGMTNADILAQFNNKPALLFALTTGNVYRGSEGRIYPTPRGLL
jgi:hypothetical protein